MEGTLDYLLELRKRLLACALATAAVFVVFAFMANEIYSVFTLPLLKHFSLGQALIATSVPSPFLVPFKSAFVAAFYVTVPYWLYQLWHFVAPALHQHEKRNLWLLLLTSSLLFYAGTLFAYFVVLPLVLNFFLQSAPVSVAVRPDISLYLSFVLRMLFAFGVSFELPIAMLVFVGTGITTREALAAKRPYVIVFAFILGMLLTPPDVLSQVALAVPLCILFELGLFIAKFVRNPLHLSDNRLR